MLTANRGFCGGFNGNVVRAAGFIAGDELTSRSARTAGWKSPASAASRPSNSAASRRSISRSRISKTSRRSTKSTCIASRYLDEYATGKLDRLDVVYTKFVNIARQQVTIETLLPLGALAAEAAATDAKTETASRAIYEFLPSPESILEEVVPASFKMKLFKCFLDSAVSEQIARMVAMKSATENAGDLIQQLEHAIQPRPPRPHHVRIDGRDRRRRGAELTRSNHWRFAEH